MKKLLLFAALIAAGLPASAQMVTVMGASTRLSSGPLATGQVCFAPTLQDGTPASYQMPGGGQGTTTRVCTQVTGGAFSIQLPDTTLTSPSGICFAASMPGAGGNGFGPGYSCLQPHATSQGQTDWCQGGVCNLDKFVPNLPSIPQNQVTPPAFSIGTVTTLSPGSSATASFSGSAPNWALNLGLVQGPVGATGATGPQGASGIGTDPNCNTDSNGHLACITVAVGTTKPVAPGGACSVGYLWASNAKFVSPEMCGAKADGVTDDSAAISAASNTGFPVKFSAATYAVSSISLTNVSLNWDGAGQYQTILKDIGNAASPVISINGGTGLGGYTSGLRIANMTIDGNQQGIQVAGRYALQVQTYNGQGIALDNIRIINAKDTGLYLGPDVYHATGKVFVYQSPFNYAVQCTGPSGSYANANDLTIVATDTGGGIYANGCNYNRWNVDLEDPDSSWTGSNPYSGTNVGTQGAIVEAGATVGNEYDGYIEWSHTPSSGNVVSISGSSKPVFSFRNISLNAAVTNLMYLSGTGGATLRDSNIAINSTGSVSGAVVQFANTNTSPLVQGNRFLNFSAGTPTGILVGTSVTYGTFNNDWEVGFDSAHRYSFASTTTGSHVMDSGFITQSSAPTVACATSITAPAETFAVSGTCEIDTINVPWSGYSGTIYIRPTSSFTTGTTGNITTAMTVGTPVALTYFPSVSLWYPTVGALNFTNSLSKSGGTVQLSGDSASPGNNSYYGTNSLGVRGFYSLPSSLFTSYTAGTLPACSGTSKGMHAAVTDATSPSYLGVLTGGGSVYAPVVCNGASWVSY